MNNTSTSWTKRIRLPLLLVSSYVSRNRFYFLLGLALSVVVISVFPVITPLFSVKKTPRIGLAGTFTISSLPDHIQNLISFGLTSLTNDSQATSAGSYSWSATDSGKKVTFNLRSDLKWQDGQDFNSDHINYNLKGVSLTKDNLNTISFHFTEPFAPLPTVLSQPLFKSGLVGLGDNVVKNIKFQGRFVSQIELFDKKTKTPTVYKFYPRENELITALYLGAIDQAINIHDPQLLPKDDKYLINGATQSALIVTLFYDTRQALLSEKQVRQALTYALPDEFVGERAYTPAPKNSWFLSNSVKKYRQNFATAKNLLQKSASQSAKVKINLSVSPGLSQTASQIQNSWANIGVDSDIQVVEYIPEKFDVYLTFLEIPPDPDQYMLWHSTQTGNISHLKNPKIDKLLEEGRGTLDQTQRKSIYSDFQKAITEEVPAAFLYYPQVYTVSRK